jgi:hypothetical protein
MRMQGPLDGAPGAPKYWPSFVSLHPSLWLFWTALTRRRILPWNPELWQTPRQLWDPFWIRFRIPAMYRARHMMLTIIFTMPFIMSAEPNHFASSAVTPRGYKASLVTPAQPTSSRTMSLYSSTAFSMTQKRNREIDLKENKRGLF